MICIALRKCTRKSRRRAGHHVTAHLRPIQLSSQKATSRIGRAQQKWLISDISEVLKGVDSQVKTEDSNKDWHSLSKECRPFVMPFTDAPPMPASYLRYIPYFAFRLIKGATWRTCPWPVQGKNASLFAIHSARRRLSPSDRNHYIPRMGDI